MNLDVREYLGTLAILAHLDLLAIPVNMERRAFLDTQEQEALQVLTDLLAHQDNRDTEVIQVTPGNKDTLEPRESRETPESQDLLLTLLVWALLFKDHQVTQV